MMRISAALTLAGVLAVAFCTFALFQTSSMAGTHPPTPVNIQFNVPPLVATSSGPVQPASGDFNHDGKVDLAVTTGAGVNVLIGNGDGTFQPPVSYALKVADGGTAIAVADMNKDGIQDIVVTTATHFGTVEVLLGNGDGTFQAPTSVNISLQGRSIAVGDFNGDGKLDVVVAQQDSSTVAVLLGNGDGTLQGPVSYATKSGPPTGLAVGDFNNDGKTDIVVAGGGVSVLLGTGTGTFLPATVFAGMAGAYQLAITDINSDGNADVVMLGSKGVSVLFGLGNGAFSGLKTSNTNGLTGFFALGDFNGDGLTDVVISGLGVMAGKGNGAFGTPAAFYQDAGFGSLIAVDVNGDGKLDVVQSGTVSTNQGVALFFGNGNGTLQAPQTFTTNSFNTLLAMGDFTNDGKIDAATLNAGSSSPTIAILPGNGDRTFKAPLASFNAVGSRAIAAGDLNGDHNLDLVVLNSLVNSSNGQIVVFLGNGDGTFGSPTTYSTGYNSVAMTVADFNHDGKLDVAVVNACVSSTNCGNGTVSVLLGNGDGSFQAAANYNVGKSPNSIVAADFNGDLVPDLAVANASGGAHGNGNIGVLINTGSGTFGAASIVVAGTGPRGIAAADFNNDGKMDLAVTNSPANTLTVLPGKGDGTFNAPSTTAGVTASTIMVVADFNGDGKLDVAVGGNGVQVLAGNGNGTFQPPVNLSQEGVLSVAGSQLRSGNITDLVIGTASQRSVTVILNQTR